MLSLLTLLITGVLIVKVFLGLTFIVSCLQEKENRASVFAALQLLCMVSLLILFLILSRTGFFQTHIGSVLLIFGATVGVAVSYLLIGRTAPNPKALEGARGLIAGEVKRFDQRDQLLCRNRSLVPGSEQYKIFYAEHPEYQEYDTKRREMGLTLGKHPGAIDRPHEGPNLAATLASLAMPLHLRCHGIVKPQAHPELKGKEVNLGPEEAAERVKGYARHLGADLVGITQINPLWVYSHRGEIFDENWEEWGKEIQLGHRYAIVFAVEMSFEMVGTAPHTPTTLESIQNYAKGAYIAAQLAGYIANMGYSATANHQRHYDLLLVPLAVDAGLGELGRLGYLMTREFGPRVRLGAVTTNLPLITDKPADIGAEHFCRICKKCAVCCPSNSIPMEDQVAFNGTLRWKLNAETCFEYWGKIGSDCNVCMRVCPWSHANTFIHKCVKSLVTRNRISRRLFSIMDDLFYGKNPKPKSGPKWARYGNDNKTRWRF